MEMTNENKHDFRFKTHGPKYMVRGPRHEWGIIVLKTGDELGAHYHNEVEETFYFLYGKGIMKIGEKEFPAGPGDAFRIEPKEAHNIFCREEFKIIFIKCPYLPEDKVAI